MDKERLLELPFWDAGDACVVCGSPNTHRHHIFFGNGLRRKSDQWGYVMPLCYEHHIGGGGIHFNRGMDLAWKEIAQKHFERHRGSREDFRREFGKSYL